MFIADIAWLLHILMDIDNYEDSPDSMGRGKTPLLDESICKINYKIGKMVK